MLQSSFTARPQLKHWITTLQLLCKQVTHFFKRFTETLALSVRTGQITVIYDVELRIYRITPKIL